MSPNKKNDSNDEIQRRTIERGVIERRETDPIKIGKMQAEWLEQDLHDEDVKNFKSFSKLLREEGGSDKIRSMVEAFNKINAVIRLVKWASGIGLTLGSIATAIREIMTFWHSGGGK